MLADEIKIKYIGGPTAMFEVAGSRFLTDPTFDPRESFYDAGLYALHKLKGPSAAADKIPEVDFILLSHDHHFDNLDHSGRKFLSRAKKVFTTSKGAERLGGNSIGLDSWQSIEMPAHDGRTITITGTPCRHGPAGGDRGPVTGFLLNFRNETKNALYITGDTVLYDGVIEVAKRFDVKLVIAFMGAAIVRNVGSAHLTMTAEEGVALAKVFDKAQIVPLHFEGWEHFTESRNEIEKKFEEAGILHRLRWAETMN